MITPRNDILNGLECWILTFQRIEILVHPMRRTAQTYLVVLVHLQYPPHEKHLSHTAVRCLGGNIAKFIFKYHIFAGPIELKYSGRADNFTELICRELIQLDVMELRGAFTVGDLWVETMEKMREYSCKTSSTD